MIKRILNRLNRYVVDFSNRDPITGIKIPKNPSVTLGNNLASWTIPTDILTDKSICYLVGAGEDISFDIEVASRYKCKVLTLDPTPRAIRHFDSKREEIQSKGISDYITMVPVGVWNEDKAMKFYAPADPSHVSHSLVNLQKTETFFEADVKTLTTIMKESGDIHIDLLKIDIEGAEYEVIKSFVREGIRPTVVCIEYDEAFNALDDGYKLRIRESLDLLIKSGYSLFHLDYPGNYTLVHKG